MMKQSTALRRLAAMIVFATVVSISACKSAKKEDEITTPSGPSADDNVLGDSDSGKAMGLQTIYFPYDSFALDGTAKNALKQNVSVMKDKASVKIQIEGHADQRGGIQYNIALGEKRANAVKKYLEDAGVAGDRVSTISYGKERPLDQGTTEAAYAKNRRANFVITSR